MNHKPNEKLEARKIENQAKSKCNVCGDKPYTLDCKIISKNNEILLKCLVCEDCALAMATIYAIKNHAVDPSLLNGYIENESKYPYEVTLHSESVKTNSICDACNSKAEYTHRITTSNGKDNIAIYSFRTLCSYHASKNKSIIENTMFRYPPQRYVA